MAVVTKQEPEKADIPEAFEHHCNGGYLVVDHVLRQEPTLEEHNVTGKVADNKLENEH